MKQEERIWLTTGQAAELCSVTPATVLNWIRKGRLDGVRTAGGHYRIKRADLDPLLAAEFSSGWNSSPNGTRTKPPLRCWDYLSDGGNVREPCKGCVVYAVRASWCFRMAARDPETGGAKRLCPTTCEECCYFRRVMGLPTRVLVVTRDGGLIQQLEADGNGEMVLRFAGNPYEASAVVQDFSPGFAVVDRDDPVEGDGVLFECLANDSRLPGLKIIMAVTTGSLPALADTMARRAVVSVLEKPFGRREIAAVIESFPVESIALTKLDSLVPEPNGGTAMISVPGMKSAVAAEVGHDGFLKTMATWNREAAEALAEEHEIGPLTEDHWRVIEFVQDYYRTYGKGPPVVKVHGETGLTAAEICRLFPCGMVKGAYRLAGLPRPPGCG